MGKYAKQAKKIHDRPLRWVYFTTGAAPKANALVRRHMSDFNGYEYKVAKVPIADAVPLPGRHRRYHIFVWYLPSEDEYKRYKAVWPPEFERRMAEVL